MTTLEVMDQIISTLDQKHLQLSIFMDLYKSFNMFNHRIFLKNYIMVLCYTGFPFILSTESNMWNWIACNLPHQCSTQVYHKDLSWVQFGSLYIYNIYVLITCLMLAMLLNSLKPFAFELNLRYLAQRIYRSGERGKVMAVASISKNLLFCMIKWEPLIRPLQNLVALLP